MFSSVKQAQVWIVAYTVVTANLQTPNQTQCRRPPAHNTIHYTPFSKTDQNFAFQCQYDFWSVIATVIKRMYRI